MISAFIEIEGAKGESQDDKHAGWIDMVWAGHGVMQPQSSSRKTAGGTVNEAEHGDFQFRKLVDSATPKLYELVCNGNHVEKVTAEFAKPIGGKPTPYLAIEMKNVIVTGVQMDANAGGESNYPTETVTLSYDAITWKYTQVDAAGKSKGNVAANWSRAKGVSA